MELNIISWNVNFIHDNWSNRLININNRLEKEIKKTDFICLQEATLPFTDTFSSVYNCLKGTDLKYFPSQELFLEKEYLYKILRGYFPRYKDFIIFMFEKMMDKLLYSCCLFNSYFGESIKRLYFDHPFIVIILTIFCPILFIGQWMFFGMLSIVNPKIPCKINDVSCRSILKIHWIINCKDSTKITIKRVDSKICYSKLKECNWI